MMRSIHIRTLVLLLLLLSQRAMAGADASGFGGPPSFDEMSIPSKKSIDSCSEIKFSEIKIPLAGGKERPRDAGRTDQFHKECYVVINGGLKVHYYWKTPSGAYMLHATGCGKLEAATRQMVKERWPVGCQIRILQSAFGASCICDRDGCMTDKKDSAVASDGLRRHNPNSPRQTGTVDDPHI